MTRNNYICTFCKHSSPENLGCWQKKSLWELLINWEDRTAPKSIFLTFRKKIKNQNERKKSEEKNELKNTTHYGNGCWWHKQTKNFVLSYFICWLTYFSDHFPQMSEILKASKYYDETKAPKMFYLV